MDNERVDVKALEAAKDIVGIVKHIVDHPDDVVVNVRPGAYRIAIELYTAPSDVRHVVGRSGHLISSLRSFISALAGKHRVRIDFDYVTEEDNARRAAEERAADQRSGTNRGVVS